MPDFAITDLLLSHFRSHRRTALAFDGRPVAIFGPNGAGKTNILEAISLLSPGRGLRRAAGADLARQPEAVGWKVAATVAGHEIVTFGEGDGARAVLIDGKPVPQVGLGRVARVLWLVPSMDRLWIEGADGRRRFLDRMAMSFLPDHADVALAYEKAMRERNRLLKDMVRDGAWYAGLEAQLAAAGVTIAANRAVALARIGAAQVGGDTAFPVAELALFTPPEAAFPEDAAAFAHTLAAGRARDMAAGRTLTGPHRSDFSAIYATKGQPAAQCSTGEQKALLISLVLANARALAAQSGGAPLLLLDEVAAHLDSGRRAALYDELAALDAQTFMTGTGQELFDSLGGRAQAIEVTEIGGLSQTTERTLP